MHCQGHGAAQNCKVQCSTFRLVARALELLLNLQVPVSNLQPGICLSQTCNLVCRLIGPACDCQQSSQLITCLPLRPMLMVSNCFYSTVKDMLNWAWCWSFSLDGMDGIAEWKGHAALTTATSWLHAQTPAASKCHLPQALSS